MTISDILRTAANASKAWPYEEARKLLKRYPNGAPEKGHILFETGYGPSGLPHIGTFNEVLRTTMVRNAFHALSDIPTRLVAFSDDLDGFRKVPDNVPNQAMLADYLGKPLTQVPDPFEKYESFAHHNNAMLREFLDSFGFEYEFVSATERYQAGAFDEALRQVLRRYQAIMDIMLPTLRKERQATYSPVLPISPKSGIVLQVPVEVVDAEAGVVRFVDTSVPGGQTIEQSILGGGAKLQWKVDWAMRWYALGVDYEMAGKDLIDSVTQSSKICRALGGRPPEGFNYEMFLDEKGEKISKSKGNGLSLEQWLTYGPQESLAFYAYREPKKAKQLHMGVIPRAVDEYWQFRGNYPKQAIEQQLGNPVHHIHDGKLPQGELPVTFGLLLNLVGVMGDASREQVWSYLQNYVPGASAETYPELDALIETRERERPGPPTRPCPALCPGPRPGCSGGQQGGASGQAHQQRQGARHHRQRQLVEPRAPLRRTPAEQTAEQTAQALPESAAHRSPAMPLRTPPRRTRRASLLSTHSTTAC